MLFFPSNYLHQLSIYGSRITIARNLDLSFHTMKKLEQISVVKISSKNQIFQTSSESLKIKIGTLLLKYRRITEVPQAWQTITNHINPKIKKTCSKDLASSNVLPDPDIKPASSMQCFRGPKNIIILGDKIVRLQLCNSHIEKNPTIPPSPQKIKTYRWPTVIKVHSLDQLLSIPKKS